jgi:hypothetical protein
MFECGPRFHGTEAKKLSTENIIANLCKKEYFSLKFNKILKKSILSIFKKFCMQSDDDENVQRLINLHCHCTL